MNSNILYSAGESVFHKGKAYIVVGREVIQTTKHRQYVLQSRQDPSKFKRARVDYISR